MKITTSKVMGLASLLMFVNAVLQIVAGGTFHIVVGALFFASGVCFAAASKKYSLKEKEAEENKAYENNDTDNQ